MALQGSDLFVVYRPASDQLFHVSASNVGVDDGTLLPKPDRDGTFVIVEEDGSIAFSETVDNGFTVVNEDLGIVDYSSGLTTITSRRFSVYATGTEFLPKPGRNGTFVVEQTGEVITYSEVIDAGEDYTA